jgi:hypothetical protein
MPIGIASVASMRRSRAMRSASAAACLDVVASTSSRRPPSRPHTSSIDFATSTLYACMRPSRPSKSRSASRPVTPRLLSRTARTPASMPDGCPTTSLAEIIACENPAWRTAASLLSSEPASDAVSIPKSSKIIAAPCRRRHVVHELEHHASQRRGREGAALARLDLLGDEELDAALLQDFHRAEHVRRPEADALQVLLGRSEPGDVVGLDQLEVERAAGAFEQQSFGQDAEALAVRQRREAEDLRVELDPVRGAVGIDVLDEPEEVQPTERGRMGIDCRNGAEIDVVDRESSCRSTK